MVTMATLGGGGGGDDGGGGGLSFSLSASPRTPTRFKLPLPVRTSRPV